ncbi:MAG: hypothetical protein IPJ57_20340 [Gemmatimonadetes bacterium]|nr:hypothetical protein [Gemmatimonadota bacterium]
MESGPARCCSTASSPGSPASRGSARWASFRSTGDSTFISKDGRTTFVVVAVNADKGDSVARLVAPVRALVQEAFARPAWTPPATRCGSPARSRSTSTCAPWWPPTESAASLRLLPLRRGSCCSPSGALVAAVLPLIIGFLAIWVTLAVVVILADHADVGLRAQHDDHARPRRGHRPYFA